MFLDKLPSIPIGIRNAGPCTVRGSPLRSILLEDLGTAWSAENLNIVRGSRAPRGPHHMECGGPCLRGFASLLAL